MCILRRRGLEGTRSTGRQGTTGGGFASTRYEEQDVAVHGRIGIGGGAGGYNTLVIGHQM